MKYDDELQDIQSDMLSEMPDSYSKIKGTWLWELFKAVAIKIYELLGLVNDTASKLNIENLQGDELDAYVRQWTDLSRKEAQPATGYIDVTGEGTIYAGTIVASESAEYEIINDVAVSGTVEVPVVAVMAGENGNAEIGTITQMVTSNANVKSITNSKAITGGVDEETDEALRERYYIRLSMPATSGNKAHYILWARECIGVGSAKATRDKAIANKVNLYVCGENGETVDNNVLKTVQNYIDPNANGDGSGVAPLGAICQVYSAGVKGVAISGKVELDNTIEADNTIKNIENAVDSYLKKISFNKTELSYARLLNTAIVCDGVADIVDFKVNNGYVNITCEETEIFTLSDFKMEVE
jgi:uncharacterized phage protein gp47/JayE|nr:MAG TPA: Baseplate J like protein [Caudoviricetes sp.]